MDKGDYIQIIVSNAAARQKKSNCPSWLNTFDAKLPEPFGKQNSVQTRQYNRNLLLKQFPELQRKTNSPAKNSSLSNKLPAFSPKKAYYKYIKEADKNVNRNDTVGISSPAWSLSAREWPPEMKRPWMSVGDYDVSRSVSNTLGRSYY